MRKLLITGTVATAAIASVVTLAPTANADLDPHFPIPSIGYCPGGEGHGGFIFDGGYCEGISYPDGTRWQVTYSSFGGATRCIIFTGAPLPPLAPPSGCGQG